MPLSPLPGLAQTAAKATAGSIAMAVTTLVLYVLARFTGIVEMPDASLVADAAVALVSAGVSAAIAWLTVYFTPNKPKDGSTLQASLVATLFAFGLVLIVFAAFLFGGAPGGVDRDAEVQQGMGAAPELAPLAIAARPGAAGPYLLQVAPVLRQHGDDGAAAAGLAPQHLAHATEVEAIAEAADLLPQVDLHGGRAARTAGVVAARRDDRPFVDGIANGSYLGHA